MLSEFYRIKSLFQNNIEKMLFNEIKEIIDDNSKIIIKKQDNESFSLVENKKNIIDFSFKNNFLIIKHTINSNNIIYNYDLNTNNKNIKIDKIDLKSLSDKQPITRFNTAYELYSTIYEYFKMTDFLKNEAVKDINDIINYSNEINSLIVLKNRVQDKYYSLNTNLKSLNDFLNMDKKFYISLFNDISTKENTLHKEIVIKNNYTRFYYKYNIKKDTVECSYKYSNFENESNQNILNEVEKLKIEKNKNLIMETLIELCKMKNFNKYDKNDMEMLNTILEVQWKKFNKSIVTKKPKI